MAAEYSRIASQVVGVNDNVLFNNGCRACKKGFISHRDDSGVFFLKGSGCRAIYKIAFTGNISVAPAADGGLLEPISIALTINGEKLGNATAIVTPAAIGDFFNVSIMTFVDIPCGCCVTVNVENASPTSAIEVENANIILERVA